MIGFVIMQIGNSETDRIYDQGIAPALLACGLEAKRVDRHNEGGLLKSEIIAFIQNADVIVADLTNERPNVYLEIGYAMGIDKFRNLILTVRNDHFLEHPERKPNTPKIHFDLAGYDILPWSRDDIAGFRTALEKRIRRRLALLTTKTTALAPVWDDEWIGDQREIARPEVGKVPKRGRMEIVAALLPPKPKFATRELAEAARAAPIDTFGWPIGVYLPNTPDGDLKPRSDGVYASVVGHFGGVLQDYWALRNNGDFYCLKSIFEDLKSEDVIYFDTRIVRVTETFMYLLRLYDKLGVDRAVGINIRIRHSGLAGRHLSSSMAGSVMIRPRATAEEEADVVVSTSLDKLEANWYST